MGALRFRDQDWRIELAARSPGGAISLVWILDTPGSIRPPGRQASMSVLQDLRKFVRQHRACGVLTIHLEPPADTAYSIEIGCRACDTALCCRVDAAAAAWDLTHTDLLLALN